MSGEPYDPDVHGSVSIGVLHARMIKCIGIHERDGEPRYGVCPHAVQEADESWSCTAGARDTIVRLTIERLRDPRLGCPGGLWAPVPDSSRTRSSRH
jgi:hypothetical protein